MFETSKKIMVIFAGGNAFSSDGPYAEHGKIQATPEDLEQYITYDIAQELAPNMIINLECLGGDLTGANQTPRDWNIIGQLIAENYYSYDGFVLLHGQDTTPWAGSQLAYSLQNLAKPVIFADGSMSNGARGLLDSRQIFITAAQIAAYSNIPEVAVLSSKGTLVKCVDAIQHNANVHNSFISRNDRILAHVGADLLVEASNVKPLPEESFLFVPIDPSIIVNVYETQFSYPMQLAAHEKVGGIIMQVAGAGDVALGNTNIRKTLRDLKERNVPVVAVTKDLHGHVDFSRSHSGNELTSLNVVSGGSMTITAAVTKLRAALSMQIPYPEISNFMEQDLFGETKSLLPRIHVPGELSKVPVYNA